MGSLGYNTNMTKQAGYKYLVTYMLTTVIYDLTVEFCGRFLVGRDFVRLREQMIQAARSGRQNIAEGHCEKSLKSYIKLAGVAKASQEELKLDYEDFLRQRKLPIWGPEHPKIREFRAFRVFWIDENHLNTPKLPDDPTEAANLLLTLIAQATFLLDRQIKSLEDKFVREGGYTENLAKKRTTHRGFGFSKTPQTPQAP